MAQSYQEFVTTVKLNSEEAKNKLEQLRRETEKWVKERDKLINGGGSKSQISNLSSLISKNEKAMAKLEKQAHNVIDTINDTDSSALNDLLQAQKQLNAEMAKTPQNTKYFHELQEKLSLVKTLISEIRDESKRATVAQQEMAAVLNNVKGSSLSQLSRAEAALQEKVNYAAYGSADYKQSLSDLKKVQQQMAAIKQEQKDVTHAIDQYNAKIKDSRKNLQTVEDENKLINRTLQNLDKSALSDVKASLQVVNERLDETERGTEKYKELTQQAKRLNSELENINAEQKESQSWWSRMVNVFNVNFGFITQAWASITGLSQTVRQTVQAFAEMEEAMADTRKYTGLTDEGVRELNESLKKIDTRTTREQLNELAGAAGRLGITSKEQILEFVDAADKINVALDDDLGQGAIDQVGKLAMAFGEDDRLGLRGAMLATGSAINELAQNSAANAGYLVDFAARVAGVGKQLGMTQSQIMGFGAVMDENLLQDEMSSTAFTQLLTKMASDTKKFAKLAGMDAKEFATLVKTDVNGALMALFENLRRTDGFETLAKMFGDMGLDGTRATGVLTTVVDKLDDVRRHQQTATEAYSEAQSVISEFNTMNTTAQAELEKAKNAFHEVAVELGEQLQPAMKLTVSSGALMVKALSTIIGYASQHKALLATLTVVLLANVAAWNAATIATKAHTAAQTLSNIAGKTAIAVQNLLKSALIAMKAVWALLTTGVKGYTLAMEEAKLASLANPFAALLTVLSVVGVAVYAGITAWQSYREEIRKNSQEYKNHMAIVDAQKSIRKKVLDDTKEEKSRIEQLTNIIRSNAYSVNERRAAIRRLQQVIPDYHAKISETGKLYDENTKAIEEYIKSLDRAATAEAIYAKKVEIAKKKLELGQQEGKIKGSLKAVQAYRDAHPEQMGSDLRYDRFTGSTYENNNALQQSQQQERIHNARLQNVQKEQKALEAEDKYLDGLLKKDDKLRQHYAETATNAEQNTTALGGTTTGGTVGTDSGSGGGGPATDAFKAAIDAQKKHNDALQAENALAYYKGEIALSEYEKRKSEIAAGGNAVLQQIYRSYGQSTLDLKVEMAKAQFDQQQKDEETRQKDSLDALSREHAQKRLALQMAAQDETSAIYGNEEALNEALFQEDQDYLRRKAALYEAGSKERMDLEMQISEEEEQHKLELATQYNRRLQQYREQWLRLGNEQQETIILQGLDDLHKKGLVKEEEYQEMLQEIRKQAALQKSEDNLANSKREQTTNDANRLFQTAQNNARAELGDHAGMGIGEYLTSDLSLYMTTMAKIKELQEQGIYDEEAAAEAKSQAWGTFCEGIVSKMQAAYDSVNQILTAASSYYDAQSQYEQNVTTKKYDKLIDAAGNNSAKTAKLEEQKQKELAKIKSKYNKKAMKIELAQATATMVLGAMNAYTSAFKGAPYPSNLVLAPVAAGIAMAAGLINIAAIKKQHAAEEAGYYSGGFTGGSSYRRSAGIVHEGEFVANHDAVNNANLLPVLQLIDRAQQSNTVGALTSSDVSRQLGQGSAAVVAPVVNVQADNAAMEQTMQSVQQSVEALNETVSDGIHALVSIEEIDKQYKRYNQMKNRV